MTRPVAGGSSGGPWLAPNSAEEGAQDLCQQVAASLITVRPLAEARLAQEISQQGHARGKIVLQVVP